MREAGLAGTVVLLLAGTPCGAAAQAVTEQEVCLSPDCGPGAPPARHRGEMLDGRW